MPTSNSKRTYDERTAEANEAAAAKSQAEKARGKRVYDETDVGRIIKFRQVGNEYKPIIIDKFMQEMEVAWAPLRGSQELFLKASEPEVLYEGTRGPGKTLTLLMDFGQHVGQGYGGDWKGVLFRQTYPQLADVISMSKKWFKRIWPDAFFNEIKTFWQWPTGEILYFRPFAKPEDYDNFHGHNYPWIGWEELTAWPDPDCFKVMFTCSRSTIKGMPRKIRATTNPYGVGHNWVQARYQLYNWPVAGKILGPLISNSVDDKGIPEPPRRAVHGFLQENVILMHTEPGYVSKIKAGARNESELNAWLYGSWDIAAGGMFDDIWYSHKATIVVPDFEVPLGWRIMRAYDHGSSKPWSCGWYTESDGTDLNFPDGSVRSTVRGDLFRIGEVYGWQNHQPNIGSRDLVADIKKKIILYEAERGWRDIQNNKCIVRRGPADTGIFDDVNGVCIANDFETPCVINGFRVRGITWEKADKGPGSREQGWEQMRKRLKATMRPPGGYREIPGLFVCASCLQWLRTVPTLPRDTKKIDDVDSDAEDHIGDENRYMLRYDRGTMKTGRR